MKPCKVNGVGEPLLIVSADTHLNIFSHMKGIEETRAGHGTCDGVRHLGSVVTSKEIAVILWDLNSGQGSTPICIVVGNAGER